MRWLARGLGVSLWAVGWSWSLDASAGQASLSEWTAPTGCISVSQYQHAKSERFMHAPRHAFVFRLRRTSDAGFVMHVSDRATGRTRELRARECSTLLEAALFMIELADDGRRRPERTRLQAGKSGRSITPKVESTAPKSAVENEGRAGSAGHEEPRPNLAQQRPRPHPDEPETHGPETAEVDAKPASAAPPGDATTAPSPSEIGSKPEPTRTSAKPRERSAAKILRRPRPRSRPRPRRTNSVRRPPSRLELGIAVQAGIAIRSLFPSTPSLNFHGELRRARLAFRVGATVLPRGRVALGPARQRDYGADFIAWSGDLAVCYRPSLLSPRSQPAANRSRGWELPLCVHAGLGAIHARGFGQDIDPGSAHSIEWFRTGLSIASELELGHRGRWTVSVGLDLTPHPAKFQFIDMGSETGYTTVCCTSGLSGHLMTGWSWAWPAAGAGPTRKAPAARARTSAGRRKSARAAELSRPAGVGGLRSHER